MPIMLPIKVKTRSGKQSYRIDKNHLLQISLKSPPENNKANSELIIYLARLLDIHSTQISVHQGKKESKKMIRIDTALTLEEIYQKLGIETQHAIF